MNQDLITYYHERASEYDKIYARPERQEALKEVTAFLQVLFQGKEVLEIACGTGYWTEKIAAKAKSVLATDINDAVLEIAGNKNYASKNVVFANEDVFDKNSRQTQFDALFGGFIWSHVLREHLPGFLENTLKKVKPGGLVVFIDNIYQEGSSSLIHEVDSNGNSFQVRVLENGSKHLVLKNFMDEQMLYDHFSVFANDVRYYDCKYYWLLAGVKKETL